LFAQLQLLNSQSHEQPPDTSQVGTARCAVRGEALTG
jgi:hypothetical protein